MLLTLRSQDDCPKTDRDDRDGIVRVGGQPPLPPPDRAKWAPLQGDQVLDHIGILNPATTRIMATHHTGFLEMMDRIIILEDGKCVLEGRFDSQGSLSWQEQTNSPKPFPNGKIIVLQGAFIVLPPQVLRD